MKAKIEMPIYLEQPQKPYMRNRRFLSLTGYLHVLCGYFGYVAVKKRTGRIVKAYYNSRGGK